MVLPHRRGWVHAQIKEHPRGHPPFESGRDFPFSVNVVLRGQGVFVDHTGKRWPLMPGACTFCFPGLSSRASYEPRSHFLEFFLVFDRYTSRSLRDLGFVRRMCYSSHSPTGALRERISEVMCWVGMSDRELDSKDLLLKLVAFVGELQQGGEEAVVGDTAAERIGSACQILEDPALRTMPVAEVARKVGLSYHAFRTAFMMHKGCTPLNYRIQRRIARACELLRTHSVKKVAAELGYRDPFTFSGQFKRYVGVPPSQFRAGGENT